MVKKVVTPTPIGVVATPAVEVKTVKSENIVMGGAPYNPRVTHTIMAWDICKSAVPCTVEQLKEKLHYKLPDDTQKDHEDFIGYMTRHNHLEIKG